MKTKIDFRQIARALRLRVTSATVSSPAQIDTRRRRLGALLPNGEQGQAMVELALILPAIFAVLTAIATFAVGFNNQLTLINATGAGAQYLALIRTSTTDPCADTLTAMQQSAPSLTASSIHISVTMDGVTPTQTGNSCSGAQSDLVAGQPVTVTATYPCALLIYGPPFLSTCTLHAKATEYEY
jgi:Flp pilus assembly protein TadG